MFVTVWHLCRVVGRSLWSSEMGRFQAGEQGRPRDRFYHSLIGRANKGF